MTYKLGIIYTADIMRHYTFELFCKNLSECKYSDDILVMVMTNQKQADDLFYMDLCGKYNLNYTCKRFEYENNYLNKMYDGAKYCIDNNIPYIFKLDNDVIIYPNMLNFLMENLHLLEDPQNLFLSPTITNGIPTVEQFIKDFLNEQEQQYIYSIFKEYRFSDKIWGCVDGKPLNDWNDSVAEWDGNGFFDAVRKLDTFYKGNHPVRLYDKATFQLNLFVLKYKNEIKNAKDIKPVFDTFYPYYCSNAYIMKSNTFNDMLSQKDLFVDSFEEVTLNLYRAKHNLKAIYTSGGCAIHMIYNCISYHFEYEKQFIQELLK